MKRSDAKNAGLIRYENGKPCPRGHLGERYVSTGMCCACLAIRKQEFRVANPEKAREIGRAEYRKRFAKNPEALRLIGRRSAAKNRAATKARFVEWYAKNKDRVAEQAKRWAAQNPDRIRYMGRIASSKRRARLRAAEGSYSISDIEKLFSAQRGSCACCHKKLNGKYHIDHITPLFLGGSNYPENLQLLCPKCNRSKSYKDPFLFANSIGRLL